MQNKKQGTRDFIGHKGEKFTNARMHLNEMSGIIIGCPEKSYSYNGLKKVSEFIQSIFFAATLEKRSRNQVPTDQKITVRCGIRFIKGIGSVKHQHNSQMPGENLRELLSCPRLQRFIYQVDIYK